MCRISASILHSTPWWSFPTHTALSPPFPLSQTPSVTQQECSAKSSSWRPMCPRILTALCMSSVSVPRHRLEVFLPTHNVLSGLTGAGFPQSHWLKHPFCSAFLIPHDELDVTVGGVFTPLKLANPTYQNSFPTYHSMLNPKLLLFLSCYTVYIFNFLRAINLTNLSSLHVSPNFCHFLHCNLLWDCFKKKSFCPIALILSPFYIWT